MRASPPRLPALAPASPRSPTSRPEWTCRAAAVLAGVGWAWAAGLLVLRQHLLLLHVVVAPVPPAWGVVALPVSQMALLASAAVTLGWSAFRAARRDAAIIPAPIGWLLAAWLVPLADLLRLAGVPIAHTSFEPLLLAGVTGAAAAAIAARQSCGSALDSPRWLAVVVAATAAAAAWWIGQGLAAFDDYMLGYCDFAQYGWRVANTWEGRGFLMETPDLPAFWDHFNPAMALLAPLWGAARDARMFIVLQAVCLSLPALFMYAVARRWGASQAAASAWAAAFLLFPATGQLNLNYTYGWHPVSVAMTLSSAAVLALAVDRKALAAALAVFACAWQEDVPVCLAWFSLTMAVVAWTGRRFLAQPRLAAAPHLGLAAALSPWAWLLAAAALTAGFVTIYRLAPFAQFQTGRFSGLGATPAEIILSPLLRPAVFWGNIFRPRAVAFLLALTVPLGLASVLRGWKTLAAAAVPLGVLLAWDYPPATSIAFQYHTMALPVLFLAALSGAAGRAPLRETGQDKNAPAVAPLPDRGLWTGGIAALAASFTASLALGAMPWSSPTMTDAIMQTYPGPEDGTNSLETRREGSPGNAALDRIVARVARDDARVLATGRIAAHLLTVQRLEPVGTARQRGSAFAAQAGPGHTPIQLFDWVVLDLREEFYQSRDDSERIACAALLAGFTPEYNQDDILLLRAPR